MLRLLLRYTISAVEIGTISSPRRIPVRCCDLLTMHTPHHRQLAIRPRPALQIELRNEVMVHMPCIPRLAAKIGHRLMWRSAFSNSVNVPPFLSHNERNCPQP